jgi:hypothetical protein
MQVGLHLVTSAIWKSLLQFQPTSIYHLLYLTSSTYFHQQRLWADGILIPELHKSLPVSGNFIATNVFKQHYKNMTMKKIALMSLLSVYMLNLLAQNSNEPNTNDKKATIIHTDEIISAAKKGDGLPVADSVLRVVPIEGKYNVGISVVSRSKINGKTPPDAIVHDVITEVYNIVEGNGILLVGGTLDSAQKLPAKSPIVLKIAGPSSRGKRISGGTAYEVGPGDIIVIPPNTPHGFIEIKSNKIVYTLVRIDTEKVLELKDQL